MRRLPGNAIVAAGAMLWLIGCPGEEPDDDTSSAADDDAADDDTVDDDTADDDTGDDDTADDDDGYPSVSAHVIAADVSWSIDFDAAAEGEGFVDCQYARTYEGEQFLDQPYLCPACTIQLAGTADMYAGYDECYVDTFGGDAQRPEYWGLAWSGVDGDGAAFHRGARENLSIGELATVTAVSLDAPFELSWTGEYALADLGLDGEGNLALAAEGTATLSLDAGIQLDDMRGEREWPYDCGWPLGNPGSLSTDWILEDDASFPRAWLEDACGEVVDLWDFSDSYLVLDSTQHDCGYCLQMAQQAPDFLTEMDGQGVHVRFVSMLGEGLSNVIGTPDQDAFEDYEASYGVPDQPLLKDRGFAYAIFEPYLGDDIGWPVWAIVRPDMTVLHVGKGFTGWDEMRDIILDDAGL